MIDLLILLIVSQLIIISIFLLSPRKTREISHIILGFFFLALAINLLNGYIYRAGYYNKDLTNYIFIGAPFAFLYSPLMYFYVKSITDKPFVFKLKYLLCICVLNFTFCLKQQREILHTILKNLFSGQRQ